MIRISPLMLFAIALGTAVAVASGTGSLPSGTEIASRGNALARKATSPVSDTVCQGNRSTIVKECLGFDAPDRPRDFTELGLKAACPEGGAYSLSFDAEGNARAYCSIHGE